MRMLAGLVFAFLVAGWVGYRLTATDISARDGAWLTGARWPAEVYDLMDLGVADVNDDGHLDVFTTNHSAAQVLIPGPLEMGRQLDLSEIGLQQDLRLPGLEDHAASPSPVPGSLQLFWSLERFHVEWRGEEPTTLRLTFTLPLADARGVDPDEARFEVEELRRATVGVERRIADPGLAAVDVLLDLEAGARVVLDPNLLEVPVDVELASGREWPVLVGQQGVPAPADVFRLGPLRDRHAMAWADVNGDGLIDVFLNRGGIRGRAGHMSPVPEDELALQIEGGFERLEGRRGLDKRGCPGYQAAWVDWNGDNRLDLYVTCLRGLGNRLFTQGDDGTFRDRAPELGLALTENSWAWPFLWFDVDLDGDLDLLADRKRRPVLFRGSDGAFTAEEVGPALEGVVSLSPSDYDLDGDLDVFAASWRESYVLENDDGRLRPVQASSLGLPSRALAATWLDIDNDGDGDLFTVPGGLFVNRGDGRFEPTGDGALSADRVIAARVAGADFDGDGDRDLLVAAQRERPLWRRLTDDYLRAEVDDWRRLDRSWPMFVLENQGPAGASLSIDLVGPVGNRDAVGARVDLAAGSRQLVAMVGGAESSHYSQGHYRVYFGVADATGPFRAVVHWPDRSVEAFDGLRAGRVNRLHWGSGLPVSGSSGPGS